MLDEDPEIYDRAERWIEAADWIVWKLCGREVRNVCSTGYKAIYQDGSFPSEDYLRALDERFADFLSKLDGPLGELGARAGSLTAEAAGWTGLPEGIAVAVGNVDAHVTAPGRAGDRAGPDAHGDGHLDVPHHERRRARRGAGHVRRRATAASCPGLWGYEAGQSGVGDIFAWFVEQAVPPAYHDEARRRGVDLHTHLSELAGALRVGEHGLVVLDWHNGNRSILVDHELSGLIVGLTLATRPEHVYRALLEATAFGTRKIIEAFEGAGVPVRELIAAGGLIKNPVVMQIYADVDAAAHPPDASPSRDRRSGRRCTRRSPPACTPTSAPPRRRWRRIRRDAFVPDEARAAAYDELYAHYSALHDQFGRNGLMHSLRRMRRRRHDRRAARGRCARCTPSCRATGSWRGRAGTCRRACPARS